MKIDKSKFQIAMAENCMTVNDLSDKSGVTRVAITRCVNGKSTPKPVTIGKIARALNVPVTAIIEYTAATVDSNK